jgi:ribose transport system substrate-binding protein
MVKRRDLVGLVGGAIAVAALPLHRARAAEQHKVTFFLKNVSNPFYKAVHDGAEQSAKDNNIAISFAAPTKPDNIEEQIRLVEDWVTRKPDGIVFIPVDYKAMGPSAMKIKDAKIPLIIYNNKMTNIPDTPFIGFDDEKIGYEASKHLFQALGGNGSVIHIDGVPGAITAQDRKRGLERALKEFPGITLLASQPGNYLRLAAMQVFENLMQRFPKIDGVMAANDDMAVGIVEASHSAGRDSIKVVGIDCIADAAKAIKDGRMLGSIDTMPFSQGYLSLRMMVELLNGAKLPPTISLPVNFIDRSGIDPYLLPMNQHPIPDWNMVLKSQGTT